MSAVALRNAGGLLHPAILCLACLLCGAPLLALKPTHDYRGLPEAYALVYRPLYVTTADSLHVESWFFPAQALPTQEALAAARQGAPPAYAAPPEPCPTLVVANGDADNMSSQLNFVIAFCPLGYNVVLFDWRGFGASGSWPAEQDRLAYKEYLLDYAAVLDAVFRQPEVDTARVAVYGGSTGAYLSFAAAAQEPRVRACVLRALLTTFSDVLPGLRAAKPDRDLKAPEGYPPELEPAAVAPGFTRPVMLIVGEDDAVTPVWMSEHIYEALPGRRELWIVPGAEHGGANGPEYSDFARLTERVNAFLQSIW